MLERVDVREDTAALLRDALAEQTHLVEENGDTVRVLSYCDIGCIVAVQYGKHAVTDFFFWRGGDAHIRHLLTVPVENVTAAAMNTDQTLLAYGFTDASGQTHSFCLVSMGSRRQEQWDLVECQWTTSPHAHVNLHFLEAAHGCDSLVVARVTSPACHESDPCSLGPATADSMASLCVYNIFSDLSPLGEPIIHFKKLASPWNYDRKVAWYQLDRPNSIFYCLECKEVDPPTDRGRTTTTAATDTTEDREHQEQHQEQPLVVFQLSAVHCTYGQFQREVCLDLPPSVSSRLLVALGGPFQRTPACDASLFTAAAIQVLDLGHGALCLAVQDNHRYSIFCAHWQCAMSGSFHTPPLDDPVPRMTFAALNNYVVAVLPGNRLHFWNCGPKHEPLAPFDLPTTEAIDRLFTDAFPVRLKKTFDRATFAKNSLALPFSVGLSQDRLCDILLSTSTDSKELRRHLVHCLLVNMSDREDIPVLLRNACVRNPAVLDYAFLRETFLGVTFAYFCKTLRDPDAALARFLPLTDIPTAQHAAQHSSVDIDFEVLEAARRETFGEGFPLKQRILPLAKQRIDFARAERELEAVDTLASESKAAAASKEPTFPRAFSFFRPKKSSSAAQLEKPQAPPESLPFHERALVWHLRDEPKDSSAEPQRKQYLNALHVQTSKVVHACEMLEHSCPRELQPTIFNLLEKALFVLKQLQFPVPATLHGTLARLGFQVLPRPLFVQYLNTGIFQISKDFVESFVESGDCTPELVHFFVQRLPKADREMLDLDRVWKHPEVQRHFTLQLLQERRHGIPRQTSSPTRRDASLFLPLVSTIRYADAACKPEGSSERTPEHMLLLGRVASACTVGLPHANVPLRYLVPDDE